MSKKSIRTKKKLTIQNEERAKQTTSMAEQKEQKQYRGKWRTPPF